MDSNIWKKLKLFLVILACNCSIFLQGQTIVKGMVTDAETFEPVVFANVVFKGVPVGVKTEFDGKYNLSGTTASDTLIFSFIGYETRKEAIQPGISQTIDIQLQPALYNLQEVKVLPGRNPAHTLIRKFWQNSDSTGIGRLSSYQYDNYSRSMIFIRKFGSKQERNLSLFAKEFGKFGIKTGDKDIPALPSYITESLTTRYFRKFPKDELTLVKDTKSTGLAFEGTDLIAQLINKQEDISFYNNTLQIVDKNFISPLSTFCLSYYKYYLVDTIFIGNHYCFEINVIPKRVEDPVFSGKIWIADTTFALKRISLEISEKAELNFIQRIKIQQDYEPSVSGAWFPVQTRFMADAVNIFATNFSRKSNIITDKSADPALQKSGSMKNPFPKNHSTANWNATRENSLETIDSLAIVRIESLKRNAKIRISAKLVEASVKGYYNFGALEAGPLMMMYSHNRLEGNRFRVGGRTSAVFSRSLILEGYLAYGTLDNKFKGSFQSSVFLSKQRWTRIGIQYRNDLERAGSTDEFYSSNSFLTFASSFGGSDNLSKSRVVRTWIESDLAKGLTGKVVLTNKTFSPASPEFNFGWYSDESKTNISTRYITTDVGVVLRYQPRAVYVIDGNRRFPVNFNKYPVFSLGYFRSISDVFKSDFNAGKLASGISWNSNIGGLGTLETDVTFTKIFDQLPYTMLITPAGNQTIFRSDKTYNLMNYGEFIADEAVDVFMSYHMNGLLFNKIPLIKKLSLRTVVSAHAVFGSFNEEMNGFYDPEVNPKGILPVAINGNPLSQFNILSYNEPYAELSYGIENILQFLRIDLVHRLTWLQSADSRPLALKISGVFRF